MALNIDIMAWVDVSGGDIGPGLGPGPVVSIPLVQNIRQVTESSNFEHCRTSSGSPQTREPSPESMTLNVSFPPRALSVIKSPASPLVAPHRPLQGKHGQRCSVRRFIRVGQNAVFATANWIHISFEEAKMRRQFGAAYDDYVARVRRWV
jgi:hypothetical protein